MSGPNIALIGGTGFESLPPEIFAEPMEVQTRFGSARVLSLSNNYVEPHKLYFMARHGEAHHLAPHKINYRANIAALIQLEVGAVFATNAVGSLRHELNPGSLVLLDDFIDFTRQRPQTYFDEHEDWQHTDFSVPYSQRLREAVLQAAARMNVVVTPGGTYLGCDGPRFESPAEVRLFRNWGADVVGMTGLPEVVLAREAGLEYAALAVVTNLGAGLSEEPIRHDQVTAEMAVLLPIVRELLLTAAGLSVNADFG